MVELLIDREWGPETAFGFCQRVASFGRDPTSCYATLGERIVLFHATPAETEAVCEQLHLPLQSGSDRILAANGAACRMLGYEEEELRTLAPGAILDPQDARVGAVMERWRQAGRLVAELTFMHRTGRPVPVEVSYVALREVDGGIRGSMLVRDVSQRKRVEAALAEAETHYRRLVENAPYGIYALDARGRFIELNPAAEQMLQCEPGEMIGQHFSTVIAESSLSTATEAFEAVISGRADDIEFEERIRRRSGEERLLRVTESAIREGARVIGTHGMARDITGELEQEKNLRRAQRMATVGTLIGGTNVGEGNVICGSRCIGCGSRRSLVISFSTRACARVRRKGSRCRNAFTSGPLPGSSGARRERLAR